MDRLHEHINMSSMDFNETLLAVKQEIKQEPVDYPLEPEQLNNYILNKSEVKQEYNEDTSINEIDTSYYITFVKEEVDLSEFDNTNALPNINSRSNFECDKCDKEFPTKEKLKRHCYYHNQKKASKQICMYCNKVIISNMNVHIRTHTGERPFKCNVCDKTFIQYSHLSTHMRTHAGRKPFKCQQCEKSFNESGGLKVHMRLHDGVKPYKCQICGKSFNETGNLNVHLRTHTGEKPFKCNLCPRAFTASNDLRKHIRCRHTPK